MSNEIYMLYPTCVYPVACIKKAVDDYRTICTIDILENKNEIKCVFTNSKYPVELVSKEFSNYIIEIINNGEIC